MSENAELQCAMVSRFRWVGMLAVIVMLSSMSAGVWVFFSYAPDWDTKQRMMYGTDHERRELHRKTEDPLMISVILVWFLPATISAGLLAVGHEDGYIVAFIEALPLCFLVWPMVWLEAITCCGMSYWGPPDL